MEWRLYYLTILCKWLPQCRFSIRFMQNITLVAPSIAGLLAAGQCPKTHHQLLNLQCVGDHAVNL